MWGVPGWALSHTRPPVLGACSRGPLPTGCGCGGCGRGDPSPTPQRALLRASFARCGGSTRAPGGGRLLPVCGVSGVGRCPTPDCLSLGRAAGAHYPLVPGAGVVGVGTRHRPPSARSCELALHAVGAAGGRPGGVPLACVWGVRGWALSHARLPVLGACSRGPLPTGCRCGGCRRGDPSPTPQHVLLRAGCARCGGGTRAPEGGGLMPACGASVVGRSPTPDRPSLECAAGAHYPPAVGAGEPWAWGPVTNPPARARQSQLCVLWGQHEAAEGEAPLDCVWGVRGRALSNARPPVVGACGRGPLPTCCGCGGCGRGNLSPTPQRALLRAGFARCGGGTTAPFGGALMPACGPSGVGRSPSPDRPSLGRAAGVHYPLAVGAGGVGVGTGHQPHSARSCELALRPVRAPQGRPGGAPLACVWRVRSRALLDTRPPVFGACGRGPLPTRIGWGGCGRGNSSPTPQRALLRGGFARCGGGRRAPGGGASCLHVGGLGLGALQRPTARS